MRIRIAWGGGAERLWRGEIAISKGRLSEPRPLGIEADEPGSMWLERGPCYLQPLHAGPPGEAAPLPVEAEHLVIRQRSPRTYDAVDLLVTAPLEAELFVALAASDEQTHPRWQVIPLADLVDGLHNIDLDDRGNRLFLSRTPDDRLRVRMRHRHLVFAPGERLEFELAPHLVPVEPGTRLRIKIDLVVGRTSHELWSAEQEVWAGQPVAIRQQIRLPEQEGVYDVVITVRRASGLRLPHSVAGPLNWKKQPLAERRIQFLVLSARQPDVPLRIGSQMSPVVEIDPANPKGWERIAKLLQLRGAGLFWKGPLSNASADVWQHPLGEVVRLQPGPNTADVAWEAYMLPIHQPGRPHVLEVDYPSDTPQTMGISIIEPNAAGAVLPIGLDSGVELAEQLVGQRQPQWLRHRVIFWPRTKTPMVLVTDRQQGSPAVYGRIRVLCGGEHLPRAFSTQGTESGRLIAAYLDRPLFPENFSATGSLSSLSDLDVDDWLTFYEGGTRLVEYLNYVGFGGLMISVLADGSTIYPSEILEPTPRYDTGVFLDRGQDPVRKDVLEMLFRLFDREHLQLIPALEFGAPLPELEAVLRRGGPESEGIQWIGPTGLSWQQTHPPVRGMAPYYNVLNGRVQEAMLAVVRELVGRYGHHASFAALAIHLSAHGYAQLPGFNWGLDDVTIARFERDMGLRIPGTGPQRFAERAHFLATECPSQWLQWRADQLSRFFLRIRDELRRARADSRRRTGEGGRRTGEGGTARDPSSFPLPPSSFRLYLAGANMFQSVELQRQLRPSLAQKMTMGEALLQVGIDARRYGQDQTIVLLRPEQISPCWSLSRQAVNLQIRQMDDIDRCFQDLSTAGSLFFHKPQELRLASFDMNSPFQPSYTWLVTQPVPSGWQNRRPFVHSLAVLDSQVMFDGGWQLPMGQEDSIQQLAAGYGRLPAVPFQPVGSGQQAVGSGKTSQPVTIRSATYEGSTYVYMVNDAPFSTTARVQVATSTGCRLEELSGLRQVPPLKRDADGTYWSVELEPYDLVAVRLSAPGVELSGPQVWWSDEVQESLETRIAELGERAAVLRNPPIMEVLKNPGFERPAAADSRIPGWAASNQQGVSVGLDANYPHGGAQAVRMASAGPVATLISEPFDPPTTGRLTISVWLRLRDPARQPPLRIALVGKLESRDFFVSARVGLNPGEQQPVPQLGADWQRIVVPTDDLPLEGLSRLQIRFDLLGPGELWIDDLQLCDLVFTQKEWKELIKLIAPANLKLRNREVNDCIELLEGYWPRFLLAHVPLVQAPASGHRPAGGPPEPSQAPPHEAAKETIQTSGLLNRMKNLLPKRLRF